ncbi:MAG: NifB/NifX family molybdenum-iron cluster-binding protein [Candidatus Marinarcus sp.]|uniref:NifB/NifX family molybdenum-iron cluster-binding protein n=1 Tax=Candidatus Marinarcus sp. TaxID=3100987 RepID=UPI003B00EE4B
MIAIPLDTKDSTLISKLYGSAPFFALMDAQTGTFRVVENEGAGDGEDTANFVSSTGTTCTIFYHMGEGLYKCLNENDVDVYSSLQVELTLEDIYVGFLKNDFKKLDDNNVSTLINSGNCTCAKK